MHNQIEKSMNILAEDIRKYAQKPMTNSVAEHLSVYYGAYKALCDMCGNGEHEVELTSNGTSYQMGAKVERVDTEPRKGKVHAMTSALAEKWAEHMKNEDGTTGPHWTMEQTNQVQSQKDIDCDLMHFWVAKKLGVNNTDFYAGMAKAFLDDKDALPDKLARYYQFVDKH